MASNDTPKYWAKYLNSLAQKFEDDYQEWQEQSVKNLEEYNARPWYQKILTSEDDIKMYNDWDKPYRSYKSYQPTLVDYYGWTVSEDLV